MGNIFWIDAVIILFLVTQVVIGFRHGFIVAVFNTIGALAGLFICLHFMPQLSSHLSQNSRQLIILLIALIVILMVSQMIFSRLGTKIKSKITRTPLNFVDKVLGAGVNALIFIIILGILTSLLSMLNNSYINNALNQSQIYKVLNKTTPTPVARGIAKIKSTAIDDTIPKIVGSVAPTVNQDPPKGPSSTPAIDSNKGSILKITGLASQCSQLKSGSGFVVADHKVMTNAHVVAGMQKVQVETPDGTKYRANVVDFQPDKDIAVLDAPTLTAPPIPVTADVRRNTDVVFAGYPLGGPYKSQPARVDLVTQTMMKNIYETDSTATPIYVIAGNVQKGNSGGPLLDKNGNVVGMIFGKSLDDNKSGYALTATEIHDDAQKATQNLPEVPTGACLKES
ncbi:MAG: MarP family serine protease [Micrococcaceae bacterium]